MRIDHPSNREECPLHVDFDVDFLIQWCGVRQPSADRRLNAIENTIARVGSPWRPNVPLIPQDELRLGVHTAERLTEWVQAEEYLSARGQERLALLQSEKLLDKSVACSWVRLLIKSPRPLYSETEELDG